MKYPGRSKQGNRNPQKDSLLRILPQEAVFNIYSLFFSFFQSAAAAAACSRLTGALL